MRYLPRTTSFLRLELFLIFGAALTACGQSGVVTGGNELKRDQSLITTRPLMQPQKATTPTNRVELFNGKDFSRWTFCMKGDAEPGDTWTVTNGVIHCSGKAVGYIRTEESFKNYQLTVEWRFVKMAPKADNTGVLVHIQTPDKVWPVCVQVQGKHNKQGDLFLMAGAESKEHRGLDANTPLAMRGDSNEKPVGEWNTCVAVCNGHSVTAYINGKFMNEATECSVSAGTLGIQSEGAEFEIRKVYLEPLKQP